MMLSLIEQMSGKHSLLVLTLLLGACSSTQQTPEQANASRHPQHQQHPLSQLANDPPAEGGKVLWLTGSARAASEEQARALAAEDTLVQLAHDLETDAATVNPDELLSDTPPQVVASPHDSGFLAYAQLRLPEQFRAEPGSRPQQTRARSRAQQKLQVQRLEQLTGEDRERVYARVSGRASVTVRTDESLTSAQQRARRQASHLAGMLLREEINYLRIRAFSASRGEPLSDSHLPGSGSSIEQQLLLEQVWIQSDVVHATVTLFGSGDLE